jgi:hypothetical protein
MFKSIFKKNYLKEKLFKLIKMYNNLKYLNYLKLYDFK